jgi:hypothetical protein
MYIEKTGAPLPVGTPTVNATKASGGAGFQEVLKASQADMNLDLDKIFEAASEKYGVSVNLLKAVAKAESNFNPKATSHCGAMGIMQLMPGTASSLGVTDPYDPEQNIMGGAKYLSQLLQRFDGDVKLAVAGYNAGPGNVIKYGGVPPFDETENYVTKVLGYLGTDISAGSVPGFPPSAAVLGGAAALDGISADGNALGALLSNSLLSGMSGTDAFGGLTDLLGALSEDSRNPEALSDAVMTTVYQLQLRMLQGEDDSPGIF